MLLCMLWINLTGITWLNRHHSLLNSCSSSPESLYHLWTHMNLVPIKSDLMLHHTKQSTFFCWESPLCWSQLEAYYACVAVQLPQQLDIFYLRQVSMSLLLRQIERQSAWWGSIDGGKQNAKCFKVKPKLWIVTCPSPSWCTWQQESEWQQAKIKFASGA